MGVITKHYKIQCQRPCFQRILWTISFCCKKTRYTTTCTYPYLTLGEKLQEVKKVTSTSKNTISEKDNYVAFGQNIQLEPGLLKHRLFNPLALFKGEKLPQRARMFLVWSDGTKMGLQNDGQEHPSLTAQDLIFCLLLQTCLIQVFFLLCQRHHEEFSFTRQRLRTQTERAEPMRYRGKGPKMACWQGGRKACEERDEEQK